MSFRQPEGHCAAGFSVATGTLRIGSPSIPGESIATNPGPAPRDLFHTVLPALACLVAACFFFCSSGSAQTKPVDLEAQEEQAFRQAAGQVTPSLVRIETVGGLERVGQVLTGTGPTTGVVVSPDGYIISSAFNFASKPASILVTLFDGRRLPAVQVALDKVKMLTLLKVEAE
ncbi:MAG TPA: hypothetical protein VL475_10135, partial [Planctomycetaceae bacterium]|nr:hypothetical protein [Planctomycetaceae bacterium]